MRPADSAAAAALSRSNQPVRLRWPGWWPGLGGLGVLGLAIVTLAHPSATRMHTWPWTLVAAMLWVLPLALVAARIRERCHWQLPNPLVTSGAALLALGAVASAWASPFSAASLARTWPTLGGVALYFLLHDWLSPVDGTTPRRAENLTRYGSILGAVLVAESVAGWVQGAMPSPWTVRNTVPFGHSIYTGGFIVLLLPWFALQAWQTRGAARLGWMAVAIAGLFALAGTSSRGAVAALVFVAASAATAAVVYGPWPRNRKILLMAAAVAVGVAAIFSNPRLRQLVLRQGWGDSARESNQQRSAMFDAGARLGRERPLLGWGPGTVPLAYPSVRASLDGGVDNVLELHNTPIQIWATLGLTGTIALALLVGGTLVSAVRAVRRNPRAPKTLAALAALGGTGVVTLTDHQFDLPIIAAFTAVNLALVTAAAGDGRACRLTTRLTMALLLIGAAVIAGPVFARVKDLLARRACEQGIVAWEAGREEDFIRALDRATRYAPHDSFFRHQAAAAFLRLRDKTTDPAKRLEFTRAAISRLEASLGTGVHEEFAHFNLGWLKLELENPGAAAPHFAAAARLVPDKGGVYFGLGLALQAAGRDDDAVRAFALEWISDPHNLTSPAWEVPMLAALRPAVVKETMRLYAEVRRTHPPAAVAEAWTRWWLGGRVTAADLGKGFTTEAAAFAAALPAIGSRAPLTFDAPWARLYAGWRTQDFVAVAGGDPVFGAALARRATRHRDDFRAFLTAGTEDEPALLRTLRRQRTGYGVLALHPDGPMLTDVYIVQENRLTADFAAGLLPPKGWLPGRFLLALLPPDPR